MEQQKKFRRIVGFLAARIAQLDLGAVEDPRDSQGRRWELRQVLSAVLLGLMSGCENLLELEQVTSRLSRPVRRVLGIPRRLPDTTARDVLCRIEPASLAPLLQRAVAAARRSKTLDKLEMQLPLQVVAMDGKVTKLPTWAGHYAQKHQPEEGVPYGLMRTVTSVLAAHPARPCIAVSPIPASTNEMGHFQKAFNALCDGYGELFSLVSYDQGANGEENARAVLARGKHYLFRLNDERRHMQQIATELLEIQDEIFATETSQESNDRHVVRKLRMMAVNRGKLPPLARKSELWEHTKTILCVESETWEKGRRVSEEKRYYASSLLSGAFTPEQWLFVIRRHWAVETTHQVLDQSFREDDKPWIRNHTGGMLVMLILRRIAYTLLTLYRSVSLRSDDNRHMPWRVLLGWIRDTLIASTEATVASIRKRKAVPATL